MTDPQATSANPAETREAENHFRALFERLRLAVVIFEAIEEGRDFRILEFNSWAEALERIRREEVVGRLVTEVFPGVEKLGLLAVMRRVWQTGQMEKHPISFYEDDRHRGWRENEVYRLSATTVATVYEELTQAKQADQRMRFLSSAVEQSTEGMALASLDGRLMFVNEAWSRMHGYEDARELLGKPLAISHTPEQLQRDVEPFNRKVHELGSHSGEVGHVRRNGTTFPTLMASTLVRDDAGRPTALVGVAKDISEMRRREDLVAVRLLLSEQASHLDFNGILQRIVDEAEALTGSQMGFLHFLLDDQKTLSLQCWSTKTVDLFCTAKTDKRHYDVADAGVWIDCIRQRQVVIHDDYASLPHRKGMPEGHAPVTRELLVPVFRNDKIVAILGVGNKATQYTETDVQIVSELGNACWDLALRKQAEESLRELNEQLEQRVHDRTSELEAANTELQAFTYTVSHDLKAPLTSIGGLALLLEEEFSGALGEEGLQYAKHVRACAERATLLVNSLLALSRLTRTEMTRQEIDLSQMASEIVDEIRLKEPDRTVEVIIAPRMRCRADPTLLRTVMENLLGNAWKFTSQRAGATIEVHPVKGPHRETAYCVTDNGAGFDPQFADKLFGVFQRLHVPGQFPGAGVGLAAVERVVRRHGGRVWAQGEPGKGASFYFTLGKAKSQS